MFQNWHSCFAYNKLFVSFVCNLAFSLLFIPFVFPTVFHYSYSHLSPAYFQNLQKFQAKMLPITFFLVPVYCTNIHSYISIFLTLKVKRRFQLSAGCCNTEMLWLEGTGLNVVVVFWARHGERLRNTKLIHFGRFQDSCAEIWGCSQRMFLWVVVSCLFHYLFLRADK